MSPEEISAIGRRLAPNSRRISEYVISDEICRIMGYELPNWSDWEDQRTFFPLVKVTEALAASHPDLHDAADQVRIVATLLTSDDFFFPPKFAGHPYVEDFPARIEKVSQKVFGGRRAYWWPADKKHPLRSFDELYPEWVWESLGITYNKISCATPV